MFSEEETASDEMYDILSAEGSREVPESTVCKLCSNCNEGCTSPTNRCDDFVRRFTDAEEEARMVLDLIETFKPRTYTLEELGRFRRAA